MLFVNKYYAQANFPGYGTTPRTFLLSLSSSAPPHALLVAHWGSEGSALLSLPTKEYFQSSGWAEEKRAKPPQKTNGHGKGQQQAQSGANLDVRSVRSGSDFWADGLSHDTESYSAFTSGQRSSYNYNYPSESSASRDSQYLTTEEGGDEDDSQGTETQGDVEEPVVDEAGAQDAFVAGMIFALSRRLCPGPPYTPSSLGREEIPASGGDDGKWRLDECLRYE